MDIERMTDSLLQGQDKASLQALAQSPEAARLASRVDGKALEQAVKTGDENVLRGMLQNMLSTPEGQRLASRVRDAVNGHGR